MGANTTLDDDVFEAESSGAGDATDEGGFFPRSRHQSTSAV